MLGKFRLKGLFGNGQISRVGNKAHILFGSGEPFNKDACGVFLLFVGLCHHQAASALERSLGAVLKYGIRQDIVFHVLHRTVGVGNGITVEQDTRRGTGGANEVARLGEVGGIAVVYGDTALYCGSIDRFKNMRVGISVKGKGLTLKNAVPELSHTHLGKVKPGIGSVELLAAAVLVIHFGKLSDPLKGGKHIPGSTRGSRKAVEQGAVDIENFGRLGDREHIQTAIGQTAFLHKRLNVCG